MEIQNDALYKHYKGGFYRVLNTAKHTETEEMLVLYYNIGTLELFARPIHMWFEPIDDKGTKRFKKV